MKISTILDHIDNKHMALPVFQRGYVWNRDQVRGLMGSLYKRHPIGSLLVWATQSDTAEARGKPDLPPGVVKLLLDGQQRMTSLYGIIRGKPPEFFDGHADAFTGLQFHLEKEDFAFYSPVYMKDDPLWIDVSELMSSGNKGIASYVGLFNSSPELAPRVGEFLAKLNQILAIRDIELHTEEVTGDDKTIDVVVDIFNRVNSGGTKLSKGDLALAKICAEWPEAREKMKKVLAKWQSAGYNFNLDFLLRNINTVTTGEAKFIHLHDVPASEVKNGLARAERAIDFLLNRIDSRLGLDHDRVLFGRYAFPVMAHYVNRCGGHVQSGEDIDKLLFWYLQAAMWGRFSGSTESAIDQDLRSLEDLEGGLDRLIKELKLWHGDLRVSPGHFAGWSLGARFYPVLYLLTRVGEARDWWFGAPTLKSHLLGKMASLELHHIFPKSRLYAAGYRRAEVNAVANFCFLTKESNLWVSDREPEEYFEQVVDKHPGALESQWIPMDRQLWKIGNYLDFLEARRTLLAEATNEFLSSLLRQELPQSLSGPVVEVEAEPLPGGFDADGEEEQLADLNEWITGHELPEGELLYELADPETGDPIAILDLAWGSGLQEGLSEPVAVLLNEGPETLAAANAHGFRYFTEIEAFKNYVESDVLAIKDLG